MDFDVELREMQQRDTISIREKVARSGLDEALTTMLPRLTSYLQEQNVQAAGEPFVRYHSSRTVERVDVDIEVGVPVSVALDGGDGSMVPGHLPGGQALVTRYEGPYEGVSEAYDALEAWIVQKTRCPVSAA
ncbi:MAG: GyrI-like domain-containing protein, partial [Chloroflexota bacterium]